MALELAKPSLDVGLFTNDLDAMRAFYEARLGLPFEEMLPVGGGVRQYRFGLLGSVLKVNHARDALDDGPPSGYRSLTFVSEHAAGFDGLDPDGLPVACVSPGGEVDQIAIGIAAADVAAAREFYVTLGATEIDGAEPTGERLRLGRTVLVLREDPSPSGRGPMRARGFRYLTVQVRDTRAAIQEMSARGFEATQPVLMGDVALIAFVRDPDGNWIELSQRASIVGPLPPA